ncbi:MAG: ATP synthase F1 subunit delta [Vampirovibrionales bacterium]
MMRHLHQKIAQSYATAFLDWIAERGYTLESEMVLMETVTTLKQGLLEAFSETLWFELCHNPSFTHEEKHQLLESLASKVNHQDLSHFLTMVFENHRLAYLPMVLDALLTLWEKRRGRVKVHLQVATPMTQTLQDAIGELLKERFGFSHVSFVLTVEPSLLAGFVLRVGDQLIDTSWRTKLDHIEASLLQAS